MRTFCILLVLLATLAPVTAAPADECRNQHTYFREGGILTDPVGLGVGRLTGPGTMTDGFGQVPAITVDGARTWSFQIPCEHLRQFQVAIKLVVPDPMGQHVSDADVYIVSPTATIRIPSSRDASNLRIDNVWYDEVSFEHLVAGDHLETPGHWQVVLDGTKAGTLYQAIIQFG